MVLILLFESQSLEKPGFRFALCKRSLRWGHADILESVADAVDKRKHTAFEALNPGTLCGIKRKGSVVG